MPRPRPPCCGAPRPIIACCAMDERAAGRARVAAATGRRRMAAHPPLVLWLLAPSPSLRQPQRRHPATPPPRGVRPAASLVPKHPADASPLSQARRRGRALRHASTRDSLSQRSRPSSPPIPGCPTSTSTAVAAARTPVDTRGSAGPGNRARRRTAAARAGRYCPRRGRLTLACATKWIACCDEPGRRGPGRGHCRGARGRTRASGGTCSARRASR